MDKLDQFISIKSELSRSVNIERDCLNEETLNHYILTNNATQAIRNVMNVCRNGANSDKAFSIIGPYGSGKSSFAVYLSHLLNNDQKAIQKVPSTLKKSVETHLNNSQGYCNILLSGTPAPLNRSFLEALKISITPYYESLKLKHQNHHRTINRLLKSDEISTKVILNLIKKIRMELAQAGSKGLLIIIDEFGKFLEYTARHENDDIFLLQVLAEETHQTGDANILLFVLLHQSFEQYGKNLSSKLKNEWIKIQGRYQTLSFVDTTAESLPIIAQVFNQKLSSKTQKKITSDIQAITKKLKKYEILPPSLTEKTANGLFVKCYPLHPLTLLLLPILCQKISQNERTLFNYLGSDEPFSLTQTMRNLAPGDFIYPHHIYDYFINSETLSNTFHTSRTLSEVWIALERIANASAKEIQLLKTIALFNIANSHIIASKTILELCDKNYTKNTKLLLDKSIITYRKFNGEYRVWQGSDFDLNQAIEEQLTQLTTFNIAEHLNKNQVFLPFVAKRYSIEKHSLFYFEPVFIYADQYANINPQNNKPRIIFCFNFNNEDKNIFQNKIIKHFGEQDICVLIDNSKNIRTAAQYRIALENIERQNDIIQNDPIIHREFIQYFIDAKQKEHTQFNKILENPEKCLWYNKAKKMKCNNKRAVQTLLSETLESVYPDAPTIKNELINRDNPSAQANAGRRKLLLHLLNHHDKEDLAIEKYPAEKGMYVAIIKENEIHKKINGKWQIRRPANGKCRGVWNEIDRFFEQTKEQPKCLLELDEILTAPPFGIKKPVLPIFYIANYLYNKNEIAIYEDRIYVPFFTEQHLERLLKRPDTFTFQQFKIKGLNQELMQEYETHLLNGSAPNAQAIFRAIALFIQELPPYTRQTQEISDIAKKIIVAFKNNKSPQDLLFKKLPSACGFTGKKTQGFGAKLRIALQEIKDAYPKMLDKQINLMAQKLMINTQDKEQIKNELVKHGNTLKNYDLDKETKRFIREIATDHSDTNNYFERILTHIAYTQPTKWNDDTIATVQQKILEHSKLLLNLYRIEQYHRKGKLNHDEEKIKNLMKENLNNVSAEQQYRIVVDLLQDLANNTTLNKNQTNHQKKKN